MGISLPALATLMEWAILLAAGLAAGIISGLFGVGGGIVMTPVLHYILGFSWVDAVALSLFVIMVQSPVGLWRHHKKGAVAWRTGAALAAGGVAGVLVGHWLLPQLHIPWLKLAFALLLAFAAYQMTRRYHSDSTKLAPRPAVLVALGAAAGLVSRLLGVGGGILTVPILVLMGVPAHVAVGSSLVPVFTNALLASAVNLATGLAWLQGVPLAIGAVVGATVGVWAAHALPERGLRGVIAGGLVLVALYIAITSGVV